MDDEDPAGIFVSQDTIGRLLRKRKPTQASARIPNAGPNASQDMHEFILMVTWLVEAIYVTGEVGTIRVLIEINHKHKGKGKDHNIVESYRPLGLADPIPSLVSDAIYLRTHAQIANWVGHNQQGGQTDSSYMVIMQRGAK